MDWLQALIMGIFQGLTEFLPVSSSGHLALAGAILGVEDPDKVMMFTIAVHVATVLATLVVLWKEIAWIFRGLFKTGNQIVPSPYGIRALNEEQNYVLAILVSMIPVAIVGFFFKDWVEEMFDSLVVVGVCLLLTAFLLSFSYFLKPRTKINISLHDVFIIGKAQVCAVLPGLSRSGSTIVLEDKKEELLQYSFLRVIFLYFSKPRTKEHISLFDAFIIGIAQACAVLPGLSRSGSTIGTGLILGDKKEKLAQFSFLMVIPPILGEALLDVKKMAEMGVESAMAGISTSALVVGFIAAFITGCLACRWMIGIVRRGKLIYFAVYCAIVGFATLIWQLFF